MRLRWGRWTGAWITGALTVGEAVNFALSGESIALASFVFCFCMFLVTLVQGITWLR